MIPQKKLTAYTFLELITETVMNTMVDISYAIIDPRVKMEDL